MKLILQTNEKNSSKYRHSSSASNQNLDKKHHRKTIDEPRRKSSYDRRHDYHRHYRSPSPRYHHHHHNHHYRHHRRPHRSRYSSSSSSSFSSSPRTRTTSSSSSSRTSTSYSSISRTSSSRSSSRRHRRSPTLEKLFLKASESIEAISTQRDPNATTTTATHLIPIQTLPPEPNTFYSEHFTGFSVPPPPFIPQQHQRYLKEITTDSSTTPAQEFPANIRSTTKPPRVSRFSDITTTTTPVEPVVLNTNLPVDTVLNYAQISDNINCLSSSRRQQKRHNREVMECECTTSEYDRSRGIKACGTECLNRMLLIECSSNCPCGQFCTNRRFQKRSYASHKLALFKTEMKGYGLRTVASIRKGRFLVEYVGEVVDMDELARRSKKYKRDGNVHQYVMSLIHGTVIDSTIKGNWARFINHSCEPNCVAEKWLVNGEYRMGIFAKRDLDANEEITIDYRFETFGSADLANEKCYCGAQTCRGTISIKTNQNQNNNSTKRQTRRQAIDDDELIEYLQDDETNEYIIPKTIEEIRQLIQIMSRTDSENVRTIELDLIRTSSQKHFELPRLFLECNGLHVLCSWMKDILIDNDQQQDYSIEFKINLLDFIQNILPIKDRTIVKKNGLLELVHQKLQLPIETTTTSVVSDQQQIQNLLDQMLDHLENPITSKLFHLYSTWMSLKERFIIPKRKEPEPSSSNHHHHHHHHSSKEENSSRFSFNTRPTMSQLKPIERYSNRRTTYNHRDLPRSHEQDLSKDERRKLFEQQYEDAEKARAAAAAAANGESPTENEPPNKKQRTSEGSDPTASNTPAQPIDQTSCIHQYLSQIPLEYIQSYMASISDSNKDEPPVPPPARPEDDAVLSRMIRLPSGWSVAMCPSESSVYFYNKETMTSTWLPPSAADLSADPPLDLSPLSSAQITEQRRPSHRSKHLHRHVRTHRHHHHHLSNSNKRKRPSEIESIDVQKDPSTEEQQQQQANIDESANNETSTTVKTEDQSTNSFKVNRDLLRKNISQYVHSTLKPYTKRTCKQGRIATTEDIKYLVKKFTLAVLDKEIEKAKNDRIALSPMLTDRVRLKTELYVKKYMNKMGPVFQRHESTTTTTTVPSAPENGTSTTTNPE